jgi:hypothetical protein
LKTLLRAGLNKSLVFSFKKDLAAKRSPLSLHPATEKSGALSNRFPQKIEFS